MFVEKPEISPLKKRVSFNKDGTDDLILEMSKTPDMSESDTELSEAEEKNPLPTSSRHKSTQKLAKMRADAFHSKSSYNWNVDLKSQATDFTKIKAMNIEGASRLLKEAPTDMALADIRRLQDGMQSPSYAGKQLEVVLLNRLVQLKAGLNEKSPEVAKVVDRLVTKAQEHGFGTDESLIAFR